MRDRDEKGSLSPKLLRDAAANGHSQLDLHESQQRLAREVAAARTLQAISMRLISEVTQESLFEQILDAAMELMEADASGLQILAADGKLLTLLGWRNFPPAAIEHWREVSIDAACSCAMTLRQQERIVVGDIETCAFLKDSKDIEQYRRSGIRAFQLTPLLSRTGRPLGVISTHWARLHTPTEGDLMSLDVLARQAADLIERTRAETALRTSETKYRSLFESMDEAFYLLEIVRDKDGRPADVIYLDENAAGIRLAGASVMGRRPSEVSPRAMPEWIPILDRVAQTGVSEHFERVSTTTGNWHHYHVFPAGSGKDRVGILAKDITSRKLAEEKLRESEEKFRAIANTSPVIIWMSDASGACVFVNQPWLDFTGQTLEATLAGSGWSQPIHPDDVPHCTAIYREAAARLDKCLMEFRLRRADGEYRWILSSSAPRFHEDGSFAGYVGTSVDVTERREAEAALSSINQRLAHAQEDERARIARELHDDVVQRLVGLGLRLSVASSTARASETAVAEIESVRLDVMGIAKDVQALSHRLHPAWMDVLGTASAVRALCREASRQSGVEIACHVEDVPDGLSQENSVCLYRVLQEALQNAIKHSRSAKVEVSLRASGDEIELSVRDFGVGFDAGARRRHGLGFTSMTERLTAAGGRLSIESQPDGTTVRAYVPIEPDGAEAPK